jgi:ribose 5-phosphate isomerase B
MQNENKIGKIYLASDHAGFEMKEKVKEFLVAEYMDIKIIDEGNYVYDEKDDYTDYIHKAGHSYHRM